MCPPARPASRATRAAHRTKLLPLHDRRPVVAVVGLLLAVAVEILAEEACSVAGAVQPHRQRLTVVQSVKAVWRQVDPHPVGCAGTAPLGTDARAGQHSGSGGGRVAEPDAGRPRSRWVLCIQGASSSSSRMSSTRIKTTLGRGGPTRGEGADAGCPGDPGHDGVVSGDGDDRRKQGEGTAARHREEPSRQGQVLIR